MQELYVYYKVASADAAALLLASVAWPRVRFLRRSDGLAEDHQTWMEIHSGPDARASEQALARALLPFVIGSRHVEVFEPIKAP